MYRKNNRTYIFAVLFILTISAQFVTCSKGSSPTGTPDGVWLPATEVVNGSLAEIEGISVLRIWGTPYEKGYAHGYLLAEDITTMLENFISNNTLGMNALT